MLNNRLHLFSLLLIIIYLVGICGMVLSPELFKPITPVNLLLSAAFLFYFDRSPKRVLLMFIGTVWIAGFVVEWLGVSTGVIFGVYHYGPTLGYRLDGIPVLIGLNWFILTYCAGNMSRWLLKTANRYMQISVAAALMVAIDLCMEPLCATLDFWYWKEAVAPLQNYMAWYLCSWIFQYLFSILKIDANNPAARLLYIIQGLFFVSLLLLI